MGEGEDMKNIPVYTNPNNPRGRAYDIAIARPSKHTDRLWRSPWQPDLYWARMRGWGIKELRASLAEMLDTFGADSVDVYPITDGKPAVASMERIR